MARLAAILKALWRAFQRGEKSIATLAGNNFFLVALLFLGKAGTFLFLIMGLVILFPLSTDPLRKIPPSRLGLWPLEKREMWLLRAISPWVNPMTWAIVALALWAARGRVTVGLWAMAAGLVAAGFVISELPLPRGATMWRRVPHFPGRLDQLVRKNLREMLSTLDFYCALLLSLSTALYRIFGPPLPPEALMAMTLLVVIALSSYAQCLFGLDGVGGWSRYGLLPLSAWRILAAKDAAFLVIVVVLSAPLAPLAGLGAALVALAMGRRSSVLDPRPQARWRFSAGASPVYGIGQIIAMAFAASSIFLTSWLIVFPCVALWAGSLWWYGQKMEEKELAA
ncbi:MAG TPA: hypothetical protein VMB03_03045 [Bryobacteraceae bacterium]|nr:hypothetical protein [Bryobacteraceae bacterium]